MDSNVENPEKILQPFEVDVRERAAAASHRARVRALGARLASAPGGARRRLRALRVRSRRAVLEGKAVAHSSATLAGISHDARSVEASLRRAAREVRPAGGRLAAGLKRAGERGEKAARRLKAFLMRSSTVSGLAIDSRRVARRVRYARRSRRLRPAH